MAEGLSGDKDPISSTPSGARKLGPYVIGRKLGAGGMATVYAARQVGAHVTRLVALKVLASSVHPEDREHAAFIREAKVALRLEHPNIVRTYDVGESDGRMYLAMELVHGASLAACQKEAISTTPVNVAIRIVSDVARALHAAHELADSDGHLGLVHQDVSPQNVLVGYDGSVKLVDFGVARLGTLEGSKTDTVRGKPSYLSPEQINGKNIDRRTDVFALGILFWELLTGTRLFKRENAAATYLAVIQDPIVDVRAVNPEVSAQVAEVLTTALERERDRRFPSTDAFRRALAAACAASGIPEAAQEDVAAWINDLVPPMSTPAELEREIVTDSSPVAARGAPPVDATLRVDMAPNLAGAPRTASTLDGPVPDLDLPVSPASRPSSAARVQAPATSARPPTPGGTPAGRTLASQIAPELGPSVRISAAPSSSGRSLQPPGAPSQAPPSQRTSAPALPVPSLGGAPQGRSIAFDVPDDDDFDMQIERNSGGMQMPMATSARPSGAAGPSMSGRPSGAHRASSGGLELGASVRPSARRSRSTEANAPGIGILLMGYAAASLVGCVTAATLLKLVRPANGLDVKGLLPHAFDGSSAASSGVAAVALLIVAVVIGFVGLRLKPHAWAFMGSGVVVLLLALAMVTVMLASTGESPTPPDGVLLVPYLLPAAGVLLAIGVMGRAGRLFANREGAARAVVVPLAMFAGLIAFAALAASRAGH